MHYDAIVARRVTGLDNLKRTVLHYWRNQCKMNEQSCSRAWLAYLAGETIAGAARVGASSDPIHVQLVAQ